MVSHIGSVGDLEGLRGFVSMAARYSSAPQRTRPLGERTDLHEAILNAVSRQDLPKVDHDLRRQDLSFDELNDLFSSPSAPYLSDLIR